MTLAWATHSSVVYELFVYSFNAKLSTASFCIRHGQTYKLGFKGLALDGFDRGRGCSLHMDMHLISESRSTEASL